MISAAEIAVGLEGAGRLAKRDDSGFAYMNISIEGFWRSFSAALIVYPAFLILLATGSQGGRVGEPGFLLIETISYIIGWFAFPLAMYHLTEVIGVSERFVGYIVAVNWCNVIQFWLIAAVALIGASHVLPDGLASFLSQVAFLWTLTFSWYVARAGLGVNGWMAACIIGLDVVISLFLLSVTQSVES